MASARQCTQASAQARVTSQMTRNGARLKSTGGGIREAMPQGSTRRAGAPMMPVIGYLSDY
jgi:hypothetical protein